eukprot:COSAG01_NODE_13873_length_1524_cov_5769.965614_2_plen_56_part_01
MGAAIGLIATGVATGGLAAATVIGALAYGRMGAADAKEEANTDFFNFTVQKLKNNL